MFKVLYEKYVTTFTLLGKVPSFLRTRGRFSVRLTSRRWNMSKGWPFLFRTVGSLTLTRGRFPSPKISKNKLRFLATVEGIPSTVAYEWNLHYVQIGVWKCLILLRQMKRVLKKSSPSSSNIRVFLYDFILNMLLVKEVKPVWRIKCR